MKEKRKEINGTSLIREMKIHRSNYLFTSNLFRFSNFISLLFIYLFSFLLSDIKKIYDLNAYIIFCKRQLLVEAI